MIANQRCKKHDMHFHYWGWFLTFDYVCTIVQKCFPLSLFALFEGGFRVYLKATRRHFRHFREQTVYMYFRKITKERKLKEKLLVFLFYFYFSSFKDCIFPSDTPFQKVVGNPFLFPLPFQFFSVMSLSC